MTIIASGTPLVNVTSSREGLGDTGVVLIVGPMAASNAFNASMPPSNSTYTPHDLDAFGDTPMRFVLPPVPAPKGARRHDQHSYASGLYDRPFKLRDYPAVMTEFSRQVETVNNASSNLWTRNEQGTDVSVGFARPQNSLFTWTVVVEQARSEATAPISTLRKILLGCVFGTAGAVAILVFPCAHWSVMPIRRLKDATEKSVAPPGYHDDLARFNAYDEEGMLSGTTSKKSVKGMAAWISRKLGRHHRRRLLADAESESHRRVFKIPGKVESHKHIVTDELTELTTVFNEMSDVSITPKLSFKSNCLRKSSRKPHNRWWNSSLASTNSKRCRNCLNSTRRWMKKSPRERANWKSARRQPKQPMRAKLCSLPTSLMNSKHP